MIPSSPFHRLGHALSPRERSAVRSFVWRVLHEVPADLVEAALFGSKARGAARSDSDVDVLLVFAALPPDREPQAGIAERIASEIAGYTHVPVTVWSVSLHDMVRGNRTPMLVDALQDAIPVWCWPQPLAPIAFTPEDALRCTGALMERVCEGGAEFASHLHQGRLPCAARRARDDLVRLCTALLLVDGITRPRRGEALRRVQSGGFTYPLSPAVHRALEWGIGSFGPDGCDDDSPVLPPPAGFDDLIRAIDFLNGSVVVRARELARALGIGDLDRPVRS